jgi:hypothetical protein
MQQTPPAPSHGPASRAPVLPRTFDTRMPPAPAPGGKVLRVAAPKGGARKSDLDAGMLLGALGIAAVAAVAWRLLRRQGSRQRLL